MELWQDPGEVSGGVSEVGEWWWGEGEEHLPWIIPKPFLGSAVGSWASGEFSTFCLLLWSSLLPCRYLHGVLGADLIFTC